MEQRPIAEQAKNQKAQLSRTTDYLAQDPNTYYYNLYKQTGNQLVTDKMWTESALRGETNALINFINKNTEDKNNQYSSFIQDVNYSSLMDYDTYMLALEFPYLDDTNSKPRIDENSGYDFGEMTDKQWASMVLDASIKRLDAQLVERNKENINGFGRAMGAVGSTLATIGSSATRAVSDAMSVLVSVRESYKYAKSWLIDKIVGGDETAKSIIGYIFKAGVSNNYDSIQEAFSKAYEGKSDETADAVTALNNRLSEMSTFLDNALYDFKVNYTDMANAVDAYDAGWQLGEGETWMQQIYNAQGANVSYNGFSNIVNLVADTIGYLIPTIAVGALTGGTSAAGQGAATGAKAFFAKAFKPTIANTLYYVSGFGGNVKNDILSQRALGKDYTDINFGRMLSNAALRTTAEWAIERLLGGLLGFTGLDKLAGAGTSKGIIKGVKSLTTTASKGGLRSTGRVLAGFAKNTAQEGLEEVLQDLGTGLIDIAYGYDYKERGLENISINNLVQSFVVGALTSAIVGAVSNAKLILPKNRMIGINEQGELYRMGAFQTYNYLQAIGQINEWIDTINNTNSTEQQIADASFKIAVAIDTLGSAFNAMKESDLLAANNALVQAYVQKESKDDLAKLSSKDYASKLLEDFQKTRENLSKKYLDKKLEESIKKAAEKKSNKLKEAGVTNFNDIVTEKINPDDKDLVIGSNAAKIFKEALKKINAKAIVGVNGDIIVRSDDIVFVDNKLLNAGDLKALLKGLAYNKAIETMESSLTKQQLKLCAEMYEKITGTQGTLEDVISALLLDSRFYTYILLLTGETNTRYRSEERRNEALKILSTIDQILDKAMVEQIDKKNLEQSAYETFMKKVKESMTTGLVIYATQFVHIDFGTVSKDVISNELANELYNKVRYDKNVIFTEECNKVLSGGKVSKEEHQKRIEWFDKQIEAYRNDKTQEYIEEAKLKVRSEKTQDQIEAFKFLIDCTKVFENEKGELRSGKKVVYLPTDLKQGAKSFYIKFINELCEFFGDDATYDSLISGSFDISRMNQEARDLIRTNGYDYNNPIHRANMLDFVLVNISKNQLSVGIDGSILRVLEKTQFINAKYLGSNEDKLLQDIKQGKVKTVADVIANPDTIDDRIKNVRIIYDTNLPEGANATYVQSENAIFVRYITPQKLCHEVTHITQSLCKLTDGSIVRGATNTMFNRLSADDKRKLQKYMEDNMSLSYRFLRDMGISNDYILYLNVKGEIQANAYSLSPTFDYGFTFREFRDKDGTIKEEYLVAPNGEMFNLRIKQAKETPLAKAVRLKETQEKSTVEQKTKQPKTKVKKETKPKTEVKKETKPKKTVVGTKAEEQKKSKENIATKGKITEKVEQKKTEEVKKVSTKKPKKTNLGTQTSLFDNFDLNIDLTSKKNRDDLAKATYDFMHEKGTPGLVTADGTPIVMFRGSEPDEFENLDEVKIYGPSKRVKFNEFYTNSYTLATMYNKSTFKTTNSNIRKIQGYVFNYTKDEILPLDIKGGIWSLIPLFRFKNVKLDKGYEKALYIKTNFSPKYETDFKFYERTYYDILNTIADDSSKLNLEERFDKEFIKNRITNHLDYDNIIKEYRRGLLPTHYIAPNGKEISKEDVSKLRDIAYKRVNELFDYIEKLHKELNLSKIQIAKLMYSLIPNNNNEDDGYKFVHLEDLEKLDKQSYGFSTNEVSIIAALSGYKAVVIKNVEDLPISVEKVYNDEETEFAGVSLYRLNTVFINLESNRQLKVTNSKKSRLNNFNYLDDIINSYLLDLSQKELLEYYSIIAKRKDINNTTKYNSKSGIVTSIPKTKNLFAKEREYTLYEYVSKYIHQAAFDVHNGRLTSNLAKKLDKALKSNYGVSLLDSYFITPEGDSILKKHRFKEKGDDNKISMYDNALENNEILIQASNNLIGVNNVATDGVLETTELLDKKEISTKFNQHIEKFKNSLNSIKDLLNNDRIFDNNEKENFIKDLDKIVDNKINYDINSVLLNDKNISKNIKHLFDKLRRFSVNWAVSHSNIDYNIMRTIHNHLEPILDNYISALKLLVPNNRTETRNLLNRINYYSSLSHSSDNINDIFDEKSTKDTKTYEYTNFDFDVQSKKKIKKPKAIGLPKNLTDFYGLKITEDNRVNISQRFIDKLNSSKAKDKNAPQHADNLLPFYKKGLNNYYNKNLVNFIINVDIKELDEWLRIKIKNGKLRNTGENGLETYVARTKNMNDYTFQSIAKYFYNNKEVSKLTYSDMMSILTDLGYETNISGLPALKQLSAIYGLFTNRVNEFETRVSVLSDEDKNKYYSVISKLLGREITDIESDIFTIDELKKLLKIVDKIRKVDEYFDEKYKKALMLITTTTEDTDRKSNRRYKDKDVTDQKYLHDLFFDIYNGTVRSLWGLLNYSKFLQNNTFSGIAAVDKKKMATIDYEETLGEKKAKKEREEAINNLTSTNDAFFENITKKEKKSRILSAFKLKGLYRLLSGEDIKNYEKLQAIKKDDDKDTFKLNYLNGVIELALNKIRNYTEDELNKAFIKSITTAKTYETLIKEEREKISKTMEKLEDKADYAQRQNLINEYLGYITDKLGMINKFQKVDISDEVYNSLSDTAKSLIKIVKGKSGKNRYKIDKSSIIAKREEKWVKRKNEDGVNINRQLLLMTKSKTTEELIAIYEDLKKDNENIKNYIIEQQNIKKENERLKKELENKKKETENIKTERDKERAEFAKEKEEYTHRTRVKTERKIVNIKTKADSDEKAEPNNLVKRLLNFAFKTKTLTNVQGTERVEVDKFTKEDQTEMSMILLEYETKDFEQAIDWFENSTLEAGVGTPEFKRFYGIMNFFFVAITSNNGTSQKIFENLSDKYKKKAKEITNAIGSVGGTIGMIRSMFVDEITPFDLSNADIEIDGIPLTPEERAELGDAMRSQNFETVMRVRKNIVRRVLAERSDKRDFKRKIIAYRSMAMLSSPLTWLRNIVSNIALKNLYKMATKIGYKLFSNTQGRDQLKLNVKPTKEVTDFINKKFVDNKFFESIVSNLTKYSLSEIHPSRKNELGVATKEDVLYGMVLKSMYGEYYNENAFNSKFMNDLHRKLMKMLSDDKFVREAALDYFGRILTEKNYKELKEVNDNIMNDLGMAVGQALADYMHSDNVFNTIEKYLSERSEWAWFGYKLLMPFASASWQWAKAAFKLSPLGLSRAVINMFKLEKQITKAKTNWNNNKGILSPNLTEFMARRDLGLGIIGTLTWCFGAILAALGFMGIDDDDYGVPKLRIGPITIDISTIFGSSPLLSGVALVQGFKDEGLGFDGFLEGVKNSLALSWENIPLKNIVEFDMYSNNIGDSVLNYVESLVPSFVPNFVGYFANMTYSGKLSYDRTNFFTTILSRSVAKIPLLNTALVETGSNFLLSKKTDPYTGDQGSWVEALNRIVPYFSIELPNTIRDQSKLLGLKKSELNGKYVINEEDFQLSYSDTRKINKYYGEWNAKDIEKFYNNKLKVRIQLTDSRGNKRYVEAYYNQLTDEERKRAVSTIMANNSELCKILAWLEAGHKYYASDTIYNKLRANGIRHKNLYKGSKGFIN